MVSRVVGMCLLLLLTKTDWSVICPHWYSTENADRGKATIMLLVDREVVLDME